MKKYILILILSFYFINDSAFAQQPAVWQVPDDQKTLKNAVPSDDKSAETGQQLYDKNCKSCHGNPTMGNVIALIPPPSDLASDKVMAQTDGELFYKMTAGRGTMPTFKDLIQENDRWSIINYLRTYKAPAGMVVLKGGKITLTKDAANKKLTALVTLEQNGQTTPLADAEIGFFAQRSFGLLSLSENAIRTNANGYASVSFPSDLPGDTAGVVNFVVKLKNIRKYGVVETQDTSKWGVATKPINILSERAMWGTRANAPLWIVFLYLGITIGIWAFIVKVVGNMLKIKSLGK